jgi:hypothetical protein
MRKRYQIGDRVVYAREKYTSKPGPRAKNISAAQKGESYHYQVDKFWLVTDVLGDSVELTTRTGKTHIVDCSDPNLRKASLIERIFKSDLFPSQKTKTSLASVS